MPSTCQSISIGTEDDSPGSARMSSQRFFVSSGVSIPERNGATPRRACHCVPIGTEGDTLNPECVSMNRVCIFSGGNIPEVDNLVPTLAC